MSDRNGKEAFESSAVFLLFAGESSETKKRQSLILRMRQSWHAPAGTVCFDYPWSSEAQRMLDYDFLLSVYPAALRALSSSLNTIHNLSYQPRHWEITLGAWLRSSLSIVLDRVRILEAAQRAAHGRLILVHCGHHSPSANTEQLIRKAAVDDSWNLGLMGRIVESFSKKGFQLEEEVASGRPNSQQKEFNAVGRLRLRGTFTSWAEFFDVAFWRLIQIGRRSRGTLVWSAPYFSHTVRWALQFALYREQVVRPFQSKKLHSVESPALRENLRAQLSEEIAADNSFLQSFLALVPRLLPLSLLEGFDNELETARSRNPTPNAIFTANSHFYDDHFKIWAGNSVYSGATLAVSEHGGFLRNPENASEFQAHVADNMAIPWQTSSQSETQLVNPRFIRKRKISGKKSSEKLLIVSYELHAWSIKASATPQSYRGLEILEAIASLIGNLNAPPVHQVILKRKSGLPLWPQPWERLNGLVSSGLVLSSDSLKSELKRSRLTVCTYPETNYLEALLSGSPVILLLNPEVSVIDAPAQKVFEEMQKVGMAFTDPVEAADFISEHWQSVSTWWKSSAVTRVLDTISEYIAFPHPGSFNEWAKFLSGLGKGASASVNQDAD